MGTQKKAFGHAPTMGFPPSWGPPSFVFDYILQVIKGGAYSVGHSMTFGGIVAGGVGFLVFMNIL